MTSRAPSADFRSRLRFPPASGAIVGRRDEQQDAARIEAFEGEGGVSALLLVIADGMGGHAGGSEASRIAVDTFAWAFLERPDPPYRPRLREALEAANGAVGARAAAGRELRGMGCTLIGAVLTGNYLRWISVGDSLLLAIKEGQVVRLNADHSFKPELDRAVREGRMTREQAERDPDRHVLRSAVTGARLGLVDEGARRLGEGALVLLATDGILTLPDDRLARIASERKPAERTVAELLAAVEADMPPDQDNTSLIAAYCEGGHPTASMHRRRRRVRRALGLVALTLALGAGGFAALTYFEGEGPREPTAPTPPAPPLPRAAAAPPPAPPQGEFDGRIFKSRPPAKAGRDKSPRRPRPTAPAPAPPSPSPKAAAPATTPSPDNQAAPAAAPAPAPPPPAEPERKASPPDPTLATAAASDRSGRSGRRRL